MQRSVAQRPTGLVLASLFVIASASVMLASFQYVLVEMQVEFSFSTDSANALAFMPSAASLLVVFLAGSLADRWGPRRLLLLGITLFVAGGVLVSVAPSLGFVVVGRVLDGVGGVTMAIVALAVINSSVTEPGARARVFGLYAAVTPATFLITPPVAAGLVGWAGWRAGLVPGIVLGILALLFTVRYVPERAERGSGELVTPLLAGLVLAGLALAVTTLAISSTFSVIAISVAAVALVLLAIALRRATSPTLNVGWCRQRGVMILLVAVGLAAMPNLFFYTNLLLQYRYGASLLVIALLLIVPQACAVAGGLLSGPVSARIGPVRAAAVGLTLCSVMSLSTLFVSASSPIWVPVLALAISATPAAFIVGPLTDALLARTPQGASGAGSSVRKATWTLGNVLGGALIGAGAFSAFQSRLTEILTADGLPLEEARTIALEIRDGAVVDELAVRLAEPIAQASLLDKGPGLLAAQSHAFAVMGVMSSMLSLAAAVLMFIYMRRMRNTKADESGETTRA